MARTTKTIPLEQPDNFNHEQLAADMEKVNELALMNSQAQENAVALARDFGYDGALTVGALEDEIRFYQRRTAEACLELGKRLLLLKELTPHGEFMKRAELLGFSDRSCNRFMQAAFKFSKVANLATLTDKIGTQSKLLELVTLDDDELASLADGKSVRGLELDDIDTMTYSELKSALREARENEEAQGRILAEKNAALDKLATQLHGKEKRTTTLPPDDVAKELRSEANLHAFEAEHAILDKLIPTFQALADHSLDNGGDHTEYMLGLLVQIELACIKVRERFPLDKEHASTDKTPDWLKPE